MLSGRVCIVTGAGQGIGRAIALALAREGALVAVADIDGKMAGDVAAELCGEGGEAIAATVDVSQRAQVSAWVDAVDSRFGRIDVLVNNAGIVLMAPTLEITEEQWQQVQSVNLMGALFCSQAAAKVMLRQGSGNIINIASIAAHRSSPEASAYSASKAGLLALTGVMAAEWGPHNIRVNSISPTGVETRMGLQLRQLNPEKFERRDARIPLRRNAQVEDVAGAAVFLASDRASYITGRDLLIDGGLSLLNPGFVE
jgi:NAD(P)-dependent dehydrogenase (short-subunit alcohol dehydrogenase family)